MTIHHLQHLQNTKDRPFLRLQPVFNQMMQNVPGALKEHLGGTEAEVEDKAAAFARSNKKNPFCSDQRLLLPWTKVERKGTGAQFLDHCLAHSHLPPQLP